ncbi:MAG: hypothetical protein JNK82_25950 [Myxococcaceae bacterium]|nr:hypothetical protein [Myxococcaceae bacterium]
MTRWPDSAAARRTLRDLEARARGREMNAALSDADAAAARGDDAAAIEAWGRAATLGAPGLEPHLAAARARLERQHTAQAAAAVRQRLTAGLDAAALSAWLELTPSQRTEARSGFDDLTFGWLEQLEKHAHPRERAEVVDAALALGDALRELDAASSARLQRHAERLSAVKAARPLLERIRREADERARAEAERQQADAEREARARAERDAEQRRIDFETALQAGAALRALELVSDDAQRARLQPLLQRHFEVESGPIERAPEVGDGLFTERPARCVDVERGEFYWVEGYGRQLFVWRCDLSTGRAVSMCALTPPRAMATPELHVRGAELVITASGGLLCLDGVTWEVRDWREPAGLAAGEVVESSLAVPGWNYLWHAVRAPRGLDEEVRVVDLAKNRVHRTFAKEGIVLEVLAGPEPRVLIAGYQRPGRVYSPAGNVEQTVPLPLSEVALAPSGDGFVGLDHDDDDDGAPVNVWYARRGAAPARVDTLEDSASAGPRSLTTATGCARTFVLYDRGGGWQLVAYAPSAEGLKRQWSTPAPTRSTLVGDLSASRAYLVYARDECPGCLALGEAPPVFAPADLVRAVQPPRLHGRSLWCSPGDAPGTDDVAQTLMAESPDRREDLMKRAAKTFVEWRGAWAAVKLVLQLWRDKRDADAHRLLELVEAEAPGHAALAMGRAEVALTRGDPAAALELLTRLPRSALGGTPNALAHARHLEGLAYYHLGRLPEARAAFAGAATFEDCACHVDAWPEWVDQLSGAVTGGVVSAVRAADAALAAGDGDAAVRALDRRAVWEAMEEQLAARLATAALAAKGLPPLRRRLLLAAAAYRLRERVLGSVLPLGAEAWPPERIAAAREAALAESVATG